MFVWIGQREPSLEAGTIQSANISRHVPAVMEIVETTRNNISQQAGMVLDFHNGSDFFSSKMFRVLFFR